MSIPSLIFAILIFSIVVIFHELGHFLLAKANGIRVNEFSLGLGPTIVGFTKGETKYSIKLLPFGGACAMEGEDEESDDGKAFGNKSVWARISVVFAGPFFNFIMAFIFSAIIIGVVGYDAPVIGNVAPGYAAYEAGMKEGDEITSIDGHSIHLFREIQLYGFLNTDGHETEITYKRNGEKNTIKVKPTWSEKDGRFLFGFASSPNTDANVIDAFKNGFFEVRYWIRYTIESVKLLVTGGVSVNELSGPVGIVKNIGNTYDESVEKYGFVSALLNMLNWAILLSANLGVMNLLPLPALDGGRLVFLIIEAIRRKKIDQNKEAYVHLFGIIILLGLMVLVMFNDIRKIFL